jgi:hypothetical protein
MSVSTDPAYFEIVGSMEEHTASHCGSTVTSQILSTPGENITESMGSRAPSGSLYVDPGVETGSVPQR